MAVRQLFLRCVVPLLLLLTLTQVGQSQTGLLEVVYTGPRNHKAPIANPEGCVCKVYSLAEFGNDPNFCKWIADMIPDVIGVGTWWYEDTNIRYFAPAKILVVSHKPAVHVQVECLLTNIKNAMPPAKIPSDVLPAQFSTDAEPQQKAPKHLFHFIIRYEGAGIVDSNAVKLAKSGSNLMPLTINQNSSDPVIRMEQLMIDSENLRQIHDEWRRFWMNDQPQDLTPNRIHGGVGPASSSP